MCPVKHTLRTRGRALALTVVLTVGTAGCSVFSPFQTAETQSIGDGVAIHGLPDVQVENLALVTGLWGELTRSMQGLISGTETLV